VPGVVVADTEEADVAAAWGVRAVGDPTRAAVTVTVGVTGGMVGVGAEKGILTAVVGVVFGLEGGMKSVGVAVRPQALNSQKKAQYKIHDNVYFVLRKDLPGMDGLFVPASAVIATAYIYR